MKTKIIFPLTFAYLLTLCSCSSLFNDLKVYNGISTKRVKKQYEPESLILTDYYYYNFEYNMKEKVRLNSFNNEDSVLWQTKNSLLIGNLDLKIQDSLQNKVDTKFIRKTGKVLRPRLVKNKLVLKHIPDSNTYIVPAIHSGLYRFYRLTPLYPSLQNDYSGDTEFKVVIFIIKNKKVIYKRAVRYSEFHTQTGPAITDYRSDVRLEHLGLIVEKAMEDYIKRIKKVE